MFSIVLVIHWLCFVTRIFSLTLIDSCKLSLHNDYALNAIYYIQLLPTVVKAHIEVCKLILWIDASHNCDFFFKLAGYTITIIFHNSRPHKHNNADSSVETIFIEAMNLFLGYESIISTGQWNSQSITWSYYTCQQHTVECWSVVVTVTTTANHTYKICVLLFIINVIHTIIAIIR